MKQGEKMAAVAVEVGEQAKWDSYLAQAKKLPKRDRRAYAAAGPQTRWIMEAVEQWYNFRFLNMGAAKGPPGLPGESTLHRAGLLLPRAPLRITELIKDPPEIVQAVNQAIDELQPSRVRVLIACEKFVNGGIDRAARELGMSPPSTRKVLKEARDALAHVLRGMGWKVPKED